MRFCKRNRSRCDAHHHNRHLRRSSRRAIDIAEKYPNVYAVIGVHPTYAGEAEEDVTTPLRELAQNPRVVAIGESGLDYHRLPSVEAAKREKGAGILARLARRDRKKETR